MDLSQFINNPKNYAVKKYMLDILGERYANHQEIINRISAVLVTNDDIQDFCNLMINVYEVGFLKAFEGQKEQLEKLGFDVKIVADQKNSLPKNNEPLFKNQPN